MSLSKKIFRNIASNMAGYAINALVTMFLTPFVLQKLGDARYGVWVLTSSIFGYYGLLDLGFRAGVTQFLTQFLSTREYDKANECMSSSVAFLSAVGAFLAGLTFIVASIAPRFYSFPKGMEREIYQCILIVGFSSGIGFIFFPFMAVYTATQRFDIANLIGVGTRLLMAGGIYWMLRMDYGLVGISAASCGASLIDYTIRWRIAYRLVPQLKISWAKVRFEQLRGIGSFGVWNFLISVSTYVYQYSHMLMIGYFMPIEAVAFYGLAVGLSEQVRSVFGYVLQVFYPAAIDLHFRGDRTTLERLYSDGTRLMLLVLVPIVLIASIWADDFYRLWVGQKYLSGTLFPSVALLLRVILIGTAAMFVSGMSVQILFGAGRISLVAGCVTLEMILNLSLSLISIRTYGLLGAAVSGVIASLIVRLVIIPVVLQKTLGYRVRHVLVDGCIRPVGVGMMILPMLLGIRFVGGQAANWFHLILQGFLAAMCVGGVIIVVGITKQERERFLVNPVRKIFLASSQEN